jgi:hypothetical protein
VEILAMPRAGWILLAALGLGPSVFSGAQQVAAADPPQWIAVTAPAFRAALAPLCEERKAQGMRVVVVETTEVLTPREIRLGEAEKLKQHVHRLCKEHRGPSYVLLVGAVEAGLLPESEKKVTPALAGTAGRMRDEPSDNGYGCLDDGRLPTVPVGRFPARSEKEAEEMVAKTLAWERDRRPGEWRRRLTVLAGMPAFTPLVDRMVESMAFARFERLSPHWTGRALYHNAGSRFSMPDADLRTTALRYLEEGQCFACYFGHSGPDRFYAGDARYLDRTDWAKVKIEHGAGVFATFGCNGCQLAGREGEGYGVHALRNPRGPVAVVGSHGICFAAMVQLAADGMVDSTFAGKLPERLGTMYLGIKEGVAKKPIDAATFALLDHVDGDPKIPQATQRQEHLEMFLLLGDPALRLPDVPEDLTLAAGPATPGGMLIVQGTLPARLAGAKVHLTLERPITSQPEGLKKVPDKPGKDRDEAIRTNHAAANRFAIVEAMPEVRDGRFEARLALPEKLPWPRLILRASAATV